MKTYHFPSSKLWDNNTALVIYTTTTANQIINHKPKIMIFTALVALLSIASLATASPLPEARSLNKRYTRVQIQSYRNGECLVPEGAKWGNGFQVITKPCYQATWWDISPGSGSILLSGTSMALDAGTGTENNEIVKIWQSYPGLFQQTWALAISFSTWSCGSNFGTSWYLTPDNRIAITGGDQCLDQGDNGPQTYQCTTGNTNQSMSQHLLTYLSSTMLILVSAVWYIIEGGGSGSTTTLPADGSATTTVSSSDAPDPTTYSAEVSALTSDGSDDSSTSTATAST